MDIVRVFEEYCETKDYYFSYGAMVVHNLLTGVDSCDLDKVYLLLQPMDRKTEVSNGGLSVVSRLYSGKYLLVLSDNFDLNYFNEKGSDQALSKYTTKIEPLQITYAALEKRLMTCDGIDVVSHTNFDVTDILDVNLTGLSCTYQFRIYE